MTTAIAAPELQKSYGKHLAIDGVDLRVEQRSVFGLVGPNGAGKTTMLRMLVDIIRPTAGELTALGTAPRRSPAALRRRTGYLPGELKLSERVRGGPLLRHLSQISGPVAPGTIEALAERLGLDLSRPIRTLSKGNRQKLGLIQAFTHRPALLVLDRPTSGLDPLAQRGVPDMVREAQGAGQTVVLSSHILSEIQHVADDVAVLAHGRIAARGDVSALTASAVSRLRAVLAGSIREQLTAALSALSALRMLEDLRVGEIGEGNLVSVAATIRGEIDPVIKALAEFTLHSVIIEKPDLEESVLALYARREETP